MTVLITGASGMVGKNLLNLLKQKGIPTLTPSSRELNLLDQNSIKSYFNNNMPDAIVHCAGLVGGIQANINSPYSFFAENLMMGSNLIMMASELRIQRLINLGSSCMYPRNINREFDEKDILSGELEPTNEGYALAKVGIAKMCEYLSIEKDLKFKTIIPCNLYGKWDKFDPRNSHMIPSVIRKLHLAKLNKENATIWGDGKARREFMYVEDLSEFILFALSNYDLIDTYINVGLGYDYSIMEYYTEIAKVIGFEGGFIHDLSKPSGMNSKLCSISKQKKLGWEPKHSLNQGLVKTYNFFLCNYEL